MFQQSVYFLTSKQDQLKQLTNLTQNAKSNAIKTNSAIKANNFIFLTARNSTTYLHMYQII
jgi:hypothetical protein